MIPKQLDGSHRSFFIDESGEFRAEETVAATESSPRLE
jgi:hypothetical protein